MKPCVLTESKKAFSFTCDSNVIAKAINKVVTVADFSKGSEDKSVCLLASHKGALFVIGYSTETFSAFQVEGVKTSADGSFAFSPKTLLGLIKNRSDIEFTYDKGRLSFSAVKGKYSANIETSITPPEAMILVNNHLKNEKRKSTTVTGDLLETLRKAIKVCSLANLYNTDPVNSLIRASKGVLEVSAFDNSHLAYYRAKVSSEATFKMALPVAMFNLIDRFVASEGEDVEFVMNGKQFMVFGKTYIVTLPPVQAEDAQYDLTPNYIKALKKPVAELVFMPDGIKTVDNMFTIADENSKLILNVSGKGKVGISLTNESGSISDEFKTTATVTTKKGTFTAMIDPRVFGDLFGKCTQSEIPMKMFQKADASVSSAFMITNHTNDSKSYLIGTYHEEE